MTSSTAPSARWSSSIPLQAGGLRSLRWTTSRPQDCRSSLPSTGSIASFPIASPMSSKRSPSALTCRLCAPSESSAGLSHGPGRADWRFLQRSACSALYAGGRMRQVSRTFSDRVPIDAHRPNVLFQGSFPNKPQRARSSASSALGRSPGCSIAGADAILASDLLTEQLGIHLGATTATRPMPSRGVRAVHSNIRSDLSLTAEQSKDATFRYVYTC